MSQRLRHFALLAAFLLYVPSSASAAEIVIDFETLSDAEVIGGLLGPEVTFSNAIALTSGAVGGSLNEIDFPPLSGLNVAFDLGGPMRLDFAAPISSFSGFFTYVAPLTIEFFDASSNLLGVVASLSASNLGSPNELLSGAFAGISYLTVTGDAFGGSFTLDDVTFETTDANPVPEPGTLVLLGSGLVALLRYRQRLGKQHRA